MSLRRQAPRDRCGAQPQRSRTFSAAFTSLAGPPRGPPELFDFEEQQRQSDWDDALEMEAQMQTDDEDWAA